MSDFHRRVLEERLRRSASNADSPERFAAEGAQLLHASVATYGQHWVELHPDEETWPVDAISCCMSAAVYGPSRCTCWEPIFDTDQADPLPFADADLAVQPRMCGDCAFRKGSPERADPFEEEVLLELPARGEVFWCHQGMRRPVLYRHPRLGDMPASSADWQPPIDKTRKVPFQADGTPGLLCAGWATRADRASR